MTVVKGVAHIAFLQHSSLSYSFRMALLSYDYVCFKGAMVLPNDLLLLEGTDGMATLQVTAKSHKIHPEQTLDNH